MKKLLCVSLAVTAMAVVAEVYPYGVCSHVTRWEGSEYNLSRTISCMKMAGIRYVRSDFDANTLIKKDGTLDFTRYDKLVNELCTEDIKVLPIVGGKIWNKAPKTVKECEEHREYVKAIVSHYGMKCPVVEIWNEPNITQGMVGADPADYARALKISYEAVKSVNPRIKVAFGGVSGVPVEWIRKVFENGAANSFDIMNIHPYTSPMVPEGILDVKIEELKSLLAEHGRADAPIWITEIGWPTHEAGGRNAYVQIFLGGLKLARPEQKTWNVIVAHLKYDGDAPTQETAEVLKEVLPEGSVVEACTQVETCKRLKAGGVDAVVYPFNDTFPCETTKAVNDFITNGGVFVKMGGMPCYFAMRDDLHPTKACSAYSIKDFPFGYAAFWMGKEGEYPKETKSFPTKVGEEAGIVRDSRGIDTKRFVTNERIGAESEWIPLVTAKNKDGKELTSAVVIRYKGERKGAAVVSSLYFPWKVSDAFLVNSEEKQACCTARAMGISFAEGIQVFFPYNLRALERDPYYGEDHFGLVHADFQPKPAFSAYMNFVKERPAGSMQKAGEWHDAKRTFYYPQWTRPDGKKAGMMWTAGAEFERTIRFTGGTPTFHNMYGRKIAFREAEKGVYKLKISGSPVYFIGAETSGSNK